jgi:hypothetical protein
MHRLADEQINRQTDKPTDRQTDRQTNRQTDRQMNRQRDRHAYGQMDGHTDKQMTNLQTDWGKVNAASSNVENSIQVLSSKSVKKFFLLKIIFKTNFE